MYLKLFFWLLSVVLVLTGTTEPVFALALYSDWEDSREDKQRYPKKTLKGALNKFLGIEFGKTPQSQRLKILGTHMLGESFEYPGTAIRGHKELYDYSEYFPAAEIELPRVFRKFKRGWVFLSPTSKRVVAMHFVTDEDENLTRKDANYEMFRSFSLIVDSFPEFGFEERKLGLPPLGMMLGGSDYICSRATTRVGFPEWDFTLVCWHGGVQVGLHVVDVNQWLDAVKEVQMLKREKRERDESQLNNFLR